MFVTLYGKAIKFCGKFISIWVCCILYSVFCIPIPYIIFAECKATVVNNHKIWFWPLKAIERSGMWFTNGCQSNNERHQQQNIRSAIRMQRMWRHPILNIKYIYIYILFFFWSESCDGFLIRGCGTCTKLISQIALGEDLDERGELASLVLVLSESWTPKIPIKQMPNFSPCRSAHHIFAGPAKKARSQRSAKPQTFPHTHSYLYHSHRFFSIFFFRIKIFA